MFENDSILLIVFEDLLKLTFIFISYIRFEPLIDIFEDLIIAFQRSLCIFGNIVYTNPISF